MHCARRYSWRIHALDEIESLLLLERGERLPDSGLVAELRNARTARPQGDGGCSRGDQVAWAPALQAIGSNLPAALRARIRLQMAMRGVAP